MHRFANTVLWVYIVLLLIGGLIGFFKGKSKVSLIMSSAFAAAFTDLMFAGQSLALADAAGKVLWTKDLDAPIAVVAISAEGPVVAAGLENGILLAFDAGRSVLWEAALEAPP